VVVFAVATAYLQAIASAAAVEAVRAEVRSAEELDRQMADRVAHEVAPEIDSLRSQVQHESASQRLTTAMNQLEKDKLTLGRLIGFSIDQTFEVTDTLALHPLGGLTEETAALEALRNRADLASAEASVRGSEATVRAEKAQRLPVVSVSANYGGGGANVGNFNQVYSVAGNVTVPIYTGGRIRADIEQAHADLARKQAEYEDLKGRIAYDVKVAWLDLRASEASVRVAEHNSTLAARALTQSQDRYENGVTNLLELTQAREAVAAANDNRIASLYSFNIAMVSLSRALGNAEARLIQFSAEK
jgi:outer membrane protein TolC